MELKEQTEFLNQQIKNNTESELIIRDLNVESSKVRDLLNRYTEDIQLQGNVLITLKRQLQHDTNCLQQLRQKNHQATIDHDAKSKQIVNLKEIVDALKSKVNKIQNERNNAEDRLRHLDELYDDEEKSIQLIESEMSRLSEMVYRSSQLIHEQRNEQKVLEVS